MADIYAGLDADQLVTGEAVTLELPAASVPLRLLSGLIDVVLSVVLLLAGFLLTGALASDEALLGVGSVLTLVVVLVVLPTAVETVTRGRSVGKLAVGLRTSRSDGGPISFQHAVVRSLLGVVEIWVLSGVPAVISALVSPRGQRLGDHVAGTYVVRDRLALVLTPPVPMPPELAAWARTADIAPLPDRLAVSVRQLLSRGSGLSPAAREGLLTRLAQEVHPLVSPAPPSGTAPFALLAAVQAERRRRDEERLHREAAVRRRLTGR
ncbi:membrane protein [Marmoricola endophyticus]|uniref:Membrane protein n=1 Tax=Marmoricola endophyticus TaxID=2040280 RepID=A0A917F4U3_9ACTN|nr:RDD family protein [Marmoricola endophyticus]GGF43123.1 membrane protein [Marmoricola endophyticus]